MSRRLPVVLSLAAIAAAFVSSAFAQQQAFVPPPGAHFQINLYPITKFRGRSVVVTENDPSILALSVESVIVTRGIWELCSDRDFLGVCTRIDATREGIPVAIVTRSVRLVGDNGPALAAAPSSRAGPDAPVTNSAGALGGIFGLAPAAPPEPVRAPPSPVIAPTVAVGGVAGTNPRLAGRAVEFFPAPAQNGLRVSACSEAPGPTPAARCVQAAADGFCLANGYRDSGWREFEVITGRAYLANVLCKQAADSEGARDASGGLRLPFL